MKQCEIEIGDKQYNVRIAITDKEQSDGLKNIDKLFDNEGMLFVFDKEDQVSMWMEDTVIPLDVIFIDEDYNVVKVQQGVPKSKELITSDNTKYVLEVNAGSGIKIGDELDYDEEDEEEVPMLVIGNKGKIQMTIEGGERIFSRTSSKIIVRKAKKAYINKKDKNIYESLCKSLGKYIFKEISKQNNNEPEYVEIK